MVQYPLPKPLIVGGDHKSSTSVFCGPYQQISDTLSIVIIKTGRRLIRQDEGGADEQGAGNGHPLGLTPAQGFSPAVLKAGKADRAQGPPGIANVLPLSPHEG